MKSQPTCFWNSPNPNLRLNNNLGLHHLWLLDNDHWSWFDNRLNNCNSFIMETRSNKKMATIHTSKHKLDTLFARSS